MRIRVLFAVVALLVPVCVAAQDDTGAARDVKAIHHLIERYTKAVDTVDLDLLSQIWSHSPEVSFIYPLGEERGFDAIEQHVFKDVMGGMFSARDLETHGIAVHVNGNAAWSEFHWVFKATMRKDGSAVTTHGVETQVYRKEAGNWRLVHVHYSEDHEADKDAVLHQLDLAAANFHGTSADFQFETVTTDPIYERDVQKGIVYYKRNGKSFQMAAHIHMEATADEKGKPLNFKPVPKDLIYAGGKVTLYDKLTNQVTVKDASKYESYLLLGFGASGKELADKWDIKYLGSENLNDGATSVKTEKLELVAKDPDVSKMFPKVTIWIDPARAVSLKQIFDQGQGQSRTCLYSNIKVNQSVPDSAFSQSR